MTDLTGLFYLQSDTFCLLFFLYPFYTVTSLMFNVCFALTAETVLGVVHFVQTPDYCRYQQRVLVLSQLNKNSL